MSPNHTPNVIVFGEAGVGKSSVVNLVLGSDNKANVNSNAEGCTFDSTRYSVSIREKDYNLYDTAGLNEADSGKVDRHKAIVNLYKLVCTLADTGGVNLLIFVVKCGRLNESGKKNYDMFHQAICDAKVPIVIVVTHCENVEPMDNWWDENEERFERASLRFEGYACVCTSRGRKTKEGYANDEPFEESKGKVNTLIHAYCRSSGWKKPPLVWFKRIIPSYFRNTTKISAAYLDLYKRLLGSHSDEEARQVIGLLENGV